MADLTPLTLAIWDDPILSTVCSPVDPTEFGEGLETLGKQMLLTMREGNGIGLAASQVGLDKRLFVMLRKAPVDNHGVPGVGLAAKLKDAEEIIAVNPVVESFGEWQAHQEGCLSLPNIYGIVSRKQECRLTYQEPLKGESFTVRLSGYDAFCAAHELDHLDGVMFFDKRRMPKALSRKVLKEWESSRQKRK